MSSPQGFEYRVWSLAESMESRSRTGRVCKVVVITLLVMVLLVVYVITVQSYFVKSVV